MQDLKTQKAGLRREIRSRLEGLEAAGAKSLAVHERLFSTAWWREARWVFVYIAMPGEVDTAPIVLRAYQDGKLVAVPRMEGEEVVFYRYEGRTRELVPNQFGILEPDPLWIPVDPLQLAEGPLLVLTPGLAFDRRLRRMGRGKGYYDRFLARLRSESSLRVTAVAFCLDEQVVDAVPNGVGDLPVDAIVTDRRVLRAP
jgi:5-formyltetrahydrofolate cyclo-ligase